MLRRQAEQTLEKLSFQLREKQGECCAKTRGERSDTDGTKTISHEVAEVARSSGESSFPDGWSCHAGRAWSSKGMEGSEDVEEGTCASPAISS